VSILTSLHILFYQSSRTHRSSNSFYFRKSHTIYKYNLIIFICQYIYKYILMIFLYFFNKYDVYVKIL